MDDLKSRDWLLFSTKSLILSVDQNISIQIIDTPDGGKRLIANGITDNSIEKLYFIVNTDQNNNYLYLEDFKVYKKGSSNPLNIPGLKDIMINVFRSSDAFNFISGKKTHKPFIGSNFITASVDTFSQYIDKYTAFLPNTLTTKDVEKTYEIILNPDDWMSDIGNAMNPNTNGFNQAMNPNTNGTTQALQNAGGSMAGWNVMGAGAPTPISVSLDMLRRGLDMGKVKYGGSDINASSGVPGQQTPGQASQAAGCSIM